MKEVLWRPSAERVMNANMTIFRNSVNKKYGMSLQTYDDLYKWSISESTAFWKSMWEFGKIKASRKYDQVVTFQDMLKSRWFVGAELNFAENLLRFRDDQTALIFKGEATAPIYLSYAELYHQVARLAKTLRVMGVSVGDRVVGFMPNMIETVVVMLATTSIGAIWSSCSPDFGIKGVIDRFG